MLGSAVRLSASASYTANIAKNKHLPHSIELLDYQIESTIKFLKPSYCSCRLNSPIPSWKLALNLKIGAFMSGIESWGGGGGGKSHHRT